MAKCASHQLHRPLAVNQTLDTHRSIAITVWTPGRRLERGIVVQARIVRHECTLSIDLICNQCKQGLKY
jgi:hypothetical protein